ncbi:BPL-N domain-containing protein [Estrella lausannensis]|uniref:Biotin-protein ligase N-terminal domain-containing protein n=1 Tax=Estrella lausannensis TaxID=483423 RepID=A0A0H5E735_9BACT|nr:BPL-N domain-containing protein [Estrella lausannensis]CRX39120.1 hypothetical protein ELAC_1795 [Estrella lausannensis]
MGIKQKILVYKDAGVGGKSFRALMHSLESMERQLPCIELLDRHSAREKSAFLGARLLIMPGGRDLPYVEHLSGEAVGNIREWVEEGGAYFGICAGAYFGSSFVRFEEGTSLEIQGERELKLFPGEAVGPAFGSGVFRYNTEAGVRAAAVSVSLGSLERESLRCYFNGGCTFRGDFSSPFCKVVATYPEIAGNPPAIIRCAVGRGQAILSGVHPEFSITSLNKKDPYLQAVYPLLEEKEKERKALFESLIAALLCTEGF